MDGIGNARRVGSTRRRLAAAGMLAVGLALAPALPASAHDELVGADPAAGSTVAASLAEVRLTFEEPLVELGGHRNGILVLDADGRHHETACARISGDDLVIPVAMGSAGDYRVQWRGVSDDGHVIGSTYAFTYAPPAGTTASGGSASGPDCGIVAAGDRAESTPSTGPLIALAVGAGVVVVAVAAVLLTVLRIRRRARTGS